jgi:hypothetical protein
MASNFWATSTPLRPVMIVIFNLFASIFLRVSEHNACDMCDHISANTYVNDPELSELLKNPELLKMTLIP